MTRRLSRMCRPRILCLLLAIAASFPRTAFAECTLAGAEAGLAETFKEQASVALGSDYDTQNVGLDGEARDFHVNVALRMMSAGYVVDGIVVLQSVVNQNDVDPDYAAANIALARGYRLLGSELVPASAFIQAGARPAPSAAGQLRLNCLDKGRRLLESAIAQLEKDLVPPSEVPRPTSVDSSGARQEPPISAEATLNLLAIYLVEKAEILRDEGDLNYRTVRPEDVLKRLAARISNGGEGNTGIEKIALERYRAAQIALAEAATIGRDEQQARIRLLSESIAVRLTWLREGEAFGGRAYGQPVRPIGVKADPNDALSFTILAELESERVKLDGASTEFEMARTSALDALKDDLKSFASTYAEGEVYRYERLAALERELTRLLNEREGLGVSMAELQDVQNDRVANLEERAEQRVEQLEGERNAAVDRANEALGALRARVDAVRMLGPYKTVPIPVADVVGPITEEDVAVLGGIYGTCGQPLTPGDRPGSQDAWAALGAAGMLDGWLPGELKEFLTVLESRVQEVAGVAITTSGKDPTFRRKLDEVKAVMAALESTGSAASDMRNDTALSADWEDLIQMCWELSRRLQVEQALLANARIEIRKEELEKLQANIVEATQNAANDAIKTLEEAADATAEEFEAAIQATQDKVAEAAKQRVIEEIDRIKDRIDEVNAIIDQVVRTGQNVERAVQAAQGVFAATAAIPVGTGPGGVIFEHDSLVAAQNSAIELARFTYRATNDVLEIKQQVAALEDRLSEHAAHLKSLKLTDEVKALERRAGETMDAYLDRAREKVLETQDRLGQIYAETENIIRRDAHALADSAVRLSDSKSAVVKAELNGVVRRLERLAAERQGLRTEQEVALLDLAREATAVRDAFGEARELHDQIAVLKDELAKGIAERAESAQAPIEVIRAQDASLAMRVEVLLGEIEEVRDGRENDNPWFGARQLAAQFLAGPPSLGGDLLDRYMEMRVRLDRVNALIFEFCNAVYYLTQDASTLEYSVQATSADEAGELINLLYSTYKQRIEQAIGQQSPRVIALEILREDAERWGRIEDPSAAEDGPVYPKCFDQAASAGERCLRITTTRAELFGVRGRYNSPRCRDSDAGDEPLASVLRASTVLRPANRGRFFEGIVGCRDGDGARIATQRLFPLGADDGQTDDAVGVRGELIFDVERVAPPKEKGYVVDVVLTEPSGDADTSQLPSGLRPVGPSRQTCRDGEYAVSWTVPQPVRLAENQPDNLKRSLSTLDPALAQREIDALLDDLLSAGGLENLLGEQAGGRRRFFSGRGLSNSFDIKLPRSPLTGRYELEHDIYVFLVFIPFPCNSNVFMGAAEAQDPRPAGYRDAVDALLDREELSVERAPGARSLIMLEDRLTVARAAAAAGAIPLGARLEVLDGMFDLVARTAPPAGTELLPEDRALEEQALTAFAANWPDYLKAIEPPAGAVDPEGVIGETVQCAAEGRLVCGDDGDMSTAELDGDEFEKSTVVDMPIPLPIYDRLVRRTMLTNQVALPEFAAPEGPGGALPNELRAKREDLAKAVQLYDKAQTFADRAVTTTQALLDAKSAAERRLRFVEDATTLVERGRPDPSESLRAALCAAHLLESPGFWYLAKGSERIESVRERAVAFAAFNASCWPGQHTGECRPPRQDGAIQQNDTALGIGAACHRYLDLGAQEAADLYNSAAHFDVVVNGLLGTPQ